MRLAGIYKHHLMAAAGSGLLLTAAFPRMEITWLGWCALAPLLWILRGQRWQEGFRIGFVFGLAHYLSLIYWIAYTIKTYGNLPWALGIPILFLLCAALAVFTGIFGAVQSGLVKRPWQYLLVTPLMWAGLEYLRSFIFTGFPWLPLGNSQYPHLHLIQVADVVGVYGLSVLLVYVNVLVFHSIFYFSSLNKGLGRLSWKGFAGALLLGAVALGSVLAYGDGRLKTMDRKSAEVPEKKVAIVQGNIDQAIKWDPAFKLATITRYTDLSKTAAQKGPSLIVWPETATPFYYGVHPVLSRLVRNGMVNTGTSYLIGSPSFTTVSSHRVFHNSAFLVDPAGKTLGKYDKAHLVPFGEYVPYKKYLPFLGKMVEAVGDFRPGPKGRTLSWGNIDLGIQICYEIIFPALSRQVTLNGANILINQTNDAWYGRTSAPYQLLSMAVMRAVENRRAVVRAANTGFSAVIDPVGRIHHRTALFEEAVIWHTVPVLKKTSLYTRYGDILGIIGLVVTACLVSGRVYLALRRNKV